jgi:peptidoglycan/xylan/chitin deacetylase (PgdA/CDA1 family)
MTLDKAYFDYPHRSYGMDHDRYDWSMLNDRKPVEWPEGKKLALWVNVPLQFFPLNQKGEPFKVPGGMTMPYPDLRHFSLRQYGNRIGIYRFLKAFDQHGVKPTFAMNTRLAETNPYLLNRIVERGDEITCHGYHMDAIHWNGLGKDVENELIKTSLESLRKLTGQEIKGWLSPAKNESDHTPDLLAANGIEYFSDWVNDDMPYQFRTSNGELTAMPLTTETEDHFVINGNKHSEDSWVEQVCDAADFLRKEADTQGGRILALNIHPWLMGQPHRIAKLEKALEYITQIDGAWPAYAGEIRNNWISQQ